MRHTSRGTESEKLNTPKNPPSKVEKVLILASGKKTAPEPIRNVQDFMTAAEALAQFEAKLPTKNDAGENREAQPNALVTSLDRLMGSESATTAKRVVIKSSKTTTEPPQTNAEITWLANRRNKPPSST